MQNESTIAQPVIAVAIPIDQNQQNQHQQYYENNQNNQNRRYRNIYDAAKRKVPPCNELINIIISFIIFICCIIACFDWYWIYVQTNGGTCIASDPSSCTIDNPSCSMRLKIFLNYGTCFSNTWNSCYGFRDDSNFYTSIAQSTNTDVDYEGRNIFFATYQEHIVGGAFVAAFFSLFALPISMLNFFVNIFCCFFKNSNNNEIVENIDKRHTQSKVILCIIMILFQIPIIAHLAVAIKDLGDNDNSHDLMNPQTWMSYIDNGNKIVDDCDDPTIYKYNWLPSESQLGPAYNSALVAIILSSCLAFYNILMIIYIQYIIKYDDNCNNNINNNPNSSTTV